MSKIKLDKAYVTITAKCNLECDYCYVKASNQKELTTSEWKKVFQILSKHGVSVVQLTGGEPLMRDDFWEILKECHDRYDKVIIATNSTLIDEEKINKFNKFKNLIFYISLNNWVEEKDRTSKNNELLKKIEVLKKLKKYGHIVVISTLASNENFRDIPKIINFAKKNEIECRINYVILLNKATENMLDPVTKQFLDNFENNNSRKTITVTPQCLAGFSRISILENGDVTPCVVVRDKSYIGGNILRDDLDKIYNSEVFKKWRGESSKIDESCSKCEMLDDCKGGCPIRRLSYAKSLDKHIFVDAGMCSWNQSFKDLGLKSRIKGID